MKSPFLIALLLCVTLGLQSQSDTTYWHTTMQTMYDSMRAAPQHALALGHLLLQGDIPRRWSAGEGRLFYLMGRAQVYNQQLDSGQYYYQKSIESFEASGDRPLALARAVNQMGRAISNQDDYEGSLPYFARAEKLFRETHAQQDAMRSYISYAWALKEKGDYELAAEKIYAAIRLADTLNEPASIFNAYHELGDIQVKQGDYAAAEATYLANVQRAEDLGHNYSRSVSYGDLAMVYSYQEKHEEALEYDLKDLELQQASGNGLDLSLVYNNVASDFLSLQRPREAIHYLEQSLAQDNQHRDDYNECLSYLNLGEAYRQLQQRTQALQYATQALEKAQVIGNVQLEQDCRNTLVSFYQEWGDYESAFAEKERLQSQKDSLFSLQMQSRMAELETQYETDKKESEIVMLQQETALGKARQRLLIFGLVSALLIGALVIGFIVRNRRQERELFAQRQRNDALQKAQLQAELTHQRQQLTGKVLQLCQKNELLQTLADEVAVLRTNEDDNVRRSSQQMGSIIRRNLDTEADWEALLATFTEVHSDFLPQLQQRHADLTKGDLRLACLLRLNLSSKEISNILSISAEGTKKARYRLRRKLKLSPDEDLVRYLIGV